MSKENEIIKTVPFLRWAGGKRWLIKHIDGFLPKEGFNNYHEPFLGGGAIFFNLAHSNVSFLNDLNPELIDTYSCIKEDVEKVIEHLKTFENSKEFYYKLRAQKLNTDYEKAAKFIYLNQTSFNGIYRVNLKGEYNVPYGFRKKNFLEEETLKNASYRLAKAELSGVDFLETIGNIKENDLVFLDPPYTITHNDNGFFKYNAKLFSEEDQHKLSEMINVIKKKKAYYILTNAAHDEIKKIFNKKGDTMIELKRASLIGGRNAKRDKYEEIIVTNVKVNQSNNYEH